MFKTITLFLLTNFAVMITASVVFSLIGFTGYIGAGGINISALMAFCLVWGMSFSFISLMLSKVTAKWMMGVQVVTPEMGGEAGWVANKVHELARSAGLPDPEVGIYQSEEMNAFATGPSKGHALVAVSSGLLQRMSQPAIEGVLAHEMTHIENGDMVRMTLVQGVVNAFVMFFARIVAFAISQTVKEDYESLVRWISTMVLDIIFGFVGMIIVAWFSRQREFKADAGGARLAGRGQMIAGLEALKNFYDRVQLEEDPHPSMAALKISSRGHGLNLLFATHPPLEERIEALKSMSVQ